MSIQVENIVGKIESEVSLTGRIERGTSILGSVSMATDRYPDATAKPEDVVRGKSFYGKDGKEEGLIDPGFWDVETIIKVLDRTITDIIIPNNTTIIGCAMFQRCGLLETVVLPSTLEEISDGAFLRCYPLNIDKLPDSIIRVASSAFGHCYDLSLAELPPNIQIISNSAFQYCALTIKDIPASVILIENRAFDACGELTEITFHSKPEILGTPFINCPNIADFYVPWSEGEVANAPWGAVNATIHYNYISEE